MLRKLQTSLFRINSIFSNSQILDYKNSYVHLLIINNIYIIEVKRGLVGVYIFGSLCTEHFSCISISMHNAEC